jgi:hypothetical protein
MIFSKSGIMKKMANKLLTLFNTGAERKCGGFVQKDIHLKLLRMEEHAKTKDVLIALVKKY